MPFAPEDERNRTLAALTEACQAHPAIQALWLQGSLGRGDADAQSDIDAYVAVDDEAVQAFVADRESFLRRLGRVIVWTDLASPATRCVHALYANGTRLDLFVEPSSKIGEAKRPPFAVVLDKNGAAARLRGGWSAPAADIGRALSVVIRFTRQGAVWPARLLGRGQWSTFAMTELDLVNQQLAQLMAVQIDPANYYQHPLAVGRRLPEARRRTLDALTAQAVDAAARRDAGLALEAHLAVFDAHVREAHAACETLGTPYPLAAEDEAALRVLIEEMWPGMRPEG